VDTDLALAIFEIAIRPLAYAALIALAFAPLEELAPLRAPSAIGRRTDLAFATIGAVITQALLFLVGGALLAISERVAIPGALASIPVPARLAIALVIFELGGYGYHRLAHAWPPLFRLHAVHHSSERMDFLAAFRQHPLEIALMTLAQNLPLVLLGMPIGSHALLVILLKIHTVFVHANLRAPRAIEHVVATPRFHHRHHDRDAAAANFASLFPWIDRLFGTFAADDAQQLGLPGLTRSPSFAALLLARLDYHPRGGAPGDPRDGDPLGARVGVCDAPPRAHGR